jgi:hypothetical protein
MPCAGTHKSVQHTMLGNGADACLGQQLRNTLRLAPCLCSNPCAPCSAMPPTDGVCMRMPRTDWCRLLRMRSRACRCSVTPQLGGAPGSALEQPQRWAPRPEHCGGPQLCETGEAFSSRVCLGPFTAGGLCPSGDLTSVLRHLRSVAVGDLCPTEEAFTRGHQPGGPKSAAGLCGPATRAQHQQQSSSVEPGGDRPGGQISCRAVRPSYTSSTSATVIIC